jgi:hypothetical protein
MEKCKAKHVSINNPMYKSISIGCLAASALIITFSCSKLNHKEPESSMVKEPVNAARSMVGKNQVMDMKAEPLAVSDSTTTNMLSSAAAVEEHRDGMRFIRTADVKFQVVNVADATYKIEDLTSHYHGFVTSTDLHSIISNTETVPISADSSLYVTCYTVENDMTLRVPNQCLDSALRAMSVLVDFLDHRVITATDVADQSLGNELAKKRNSEYEQRMRQHADNNINTKRNDAVTAEEKALQGREAADNAILANRALDNQVKYSTVHLVINQRQSVRKMKISNETNIDRYRPSFVIQLWDALRNGIAMFEEIVIGLVHLWIFIALAVVAIISYRRYKKSKV